jgi:triphosphoribosyl-dephospho-CoA synthase
MELDAAITMACLLEAISPKPGNVHRGADFEDLTFTDFAVAAVAVARPLRHARQIGVGVAVLEAIRATRTLTQTNVNLGTVLLLAPLCAVPTGQSLPEGIPAVLQTLTAADAEAVYEAIRIASPSGLGQVERWDVQTAPPSDLLLAMTAASERDRVARQYVNGFADVFEFVVPKLIAGRALTGSTTASIVRTQLQYLARYPDSLIVRKCGPDIAERASRWAAQVLQAGEPNSEAYHQALADFDFWLRSDGHRRNPGTTADLLAAGIFVTLRDNLLPPPYR